MGGVDDIGGDAAFGDAAVVGAVGVVGVEVVGEVAGEAAVSDVEVAGEAWPPALFQDGLVEAFDVAVGLGSAGAGAGVAGAELLECLVEAAVEFVAVVGQYPLELPTAGGEVSGDASGDLAGLFCGGVSGGAVDQMGPCVGGVAVDRGDLPDRVLAAPETADEEAVDADQLAGPIGVDMPLGWGLAGWLVGRGVAGDQARRLLRVLRPWRFKTRQTPLGDTTRPPHLSRRSSLETRSGPCPGWPSE